MPRLSQSEIAREIFETARECDLEERLPTVSDRQGERHRRVAPHQTRGGQPVQDCLYSVQSSSVEPQREA